MHELTNQPASLSEKPIKMMARTQQWPLIYQYGLALLMAALALGVRLMLEPWAADRLIFLTFFAALLLLLLLVQPGPFLFGAVCCALGTWFAFPQPSPVRVDGGGLRLIEMTLLLGALALSCCAAWLSSRFQHRQRQFGQVCEKQREALRITLASIGEGVITTDAKGIITYLNPAAEKITGAELKQLQGQPLKDMFLWVNEDDHQTLPDPVEEVLRQCKTTTAEQPVLMVCQGGPCRLVDHNVAPIRDTQGQTTGVIVVIRDVTQRYEAERALRESEERFRVMADTAPVLIWMSAIDMACNWFNRPWLEFAGRTMEQELSQGWLERVHPEDQTHCIQTYTDAFQQRKNFTMDYRMRRHDGVYRWLLDTGTPRFDARGEFLGYIGSVVDITERKTHEKALAHSESLFRRLADTNLVGISFGDSQGHVSYINDEMLRMMGQSRDDFNHGRLNWLATIAPEYMTEDAELARQLNANGSITGYQRAFLRPDGVRTPYIGAAAVISEETDMHLTIALDLTKLTQAEEAHSRLVEKLRDADRRKDEFIAMLAHELRNPLAPIGNAVEILKRNDQDPAVRRRTYDMMSRQLSNMVRLIDDLLDLSRITHDRLTMRKTQVSLASVVEQAIETCQPAIDTANQTLTVEMPLKEIMLFGDPVRLTQVFSNLLGNASKYSPPNHPIQLFARLEGAQAVVTIKDQGLGMEPDTLLRVFDLFAQGHPRSEQTQHGLGIGLSLARRLIELHDGEIAAFSQGQGRGSEFVVRLPTQVKSGAEVLAPAAPTASSSDSVTAVSQRAQRVVLVVDDNVDAASTLTLLLRLMGYDAHPAHDGLEALRLFKEVHPEVVLMDLGLPGMDGYEIAHRIRQLPEGAQVQMIALTGWGQQSDREATQAAGFDAHLVKPVNHQALLQLLAVPPV
jgi:PAS domain S-box-containing protein